MRTPFGKWFWGTFTAGMFAVALLAKLEWREAHAQGFIRDAFQIYDSGNVAFGVAIDTGVLDTRNYTQALAYFLNNDTGGATRAFTCDFVADNVSAATTTDLGSFGTSLATPQQTGAQVGMGGGSVGGSVGANITVPFLPRKIRCTVAAGTGTGGSSRLVIHAR